MADAVAVDARVEGDRVVVVARAPDGSTLTVEVPPDVLRLLALAAGYTPPGRRGYAYIAYGRAMRRAALEVARAAEELGYRVYLAEEGEGGGFRLVAPGVVENDPYRALARLRTAAVRG